MHRFFIPPETIQAGGVDFPEETGRQISRVLRLKPGQKVIALDNLGLEYVVELTEVQGSRVKGLIEKTQPAPPEPLVRLSLYLCLSQREKFEWMLQKCTEIGASAFIPVVSSRSLVQDKEDPGGRRRERWEHILREAAEQSGRGLAPRLHPVMTFPNAAAEAVKTHQRVLLPTLDHPGRRSLRQALQGLDRDRPPELGLFIGPEGGFSEDEVRTAEAAGCLPVDLGRRVLRMETAAMAASALILYEFGELG